MYHYYVKVMSSDETLIARETMISWLDYFNRRRQSKNQHGGLMYGYLQFH